MRRVTLQDVAEHARVSAKTVSNVVHDYRHVSPAVRERVRASILELGYRPNRTGRSLATGRSSMLGLAIPDLRRPYFAELAHAFARGAAEHGYGLLLAETGDTADGERSALLDRDAGTIDGLILHPARMSIRELDELRQGMPVVLLGEDPGPAGADRVATDNVAGARDATAHLVGLGRRRIGFLGHETGSVGPTSMLRLEGYRAALAAAGLDADVRLLIPRTSGSTVAAEEALDAALGAGLELDGLVCRDDLAAIGALRALTRHGRDVPGDVAVIGWDAIELGATTVPSLTSVQPDLDELVTRSLELLVDRLGASDRPGRHVSIGHRILVRESAPAPGPSRPSEGAA